ncbi:MAG: carboxypeptidase regulatory-like domain-containing protein [Acidobacteriota bacterium]|nr:carboxypeptidase regulatory-like domain-containing protein [Acidobacteriota bacterium]
MLWGAILLFSLGWIQSRGQQALQGNVHAASRATGSIAGVVTDPTGAVVEGATVMLISSDHSDGAVIRTTTGEIGRYRLPAATGTYTVVAEAAGFARFESQPVRIEMRQNVGDDPTALVRVLDIGLKIATRVERIDVPDESTGIGDGNGDTLVLSRRDVEQMPLDPKALLQELQGLAGSPTAQLYVSGFSGGKLPARGSIGQVRIKQNPYSAENDTDPGTGVIQVTTRVGSEQLHGELYLFGDDSALNAGNPFAPGQPGYYADGSGGSVTGSLNRKAGYFAGWDQLKLAMNSAIDAETLDANFNPTQTSYAVPTPLSNVSASSRIDLRPAENSTLMLRYAFDHSVQINGGVGQLALASQGYSSNKDVQTLQVANTQTIGAKIMDETRFQLIRTRSRQTPVSSRPAIVVEGAFLDGGNELGAFSDHLDRYELQNYVSLAHGRHYVNFGGRVRVVRDANSSLADFAGEFIFSSLSAYQATARGVAARDSFVDIQNAGGGASEFRLNAGSPDAKALLVDAGLFVQEDWKLRPNLTLSYGLRFETQNYIADHADWAPRIGVSWAFGKPAKGGAKAAPNYMLHAGAGVFYKRFTADSALQVERQNGVTQEEYLVASPQFCPEVTSPAASGCPGIPILARLAAQSGTAAIYRVSRSFHAPYYVSETVGLDRRLGHFGTAGVSYLNNRGVHTQVMENVNAPLPGTYDLANSTSGVRPYGISQNMYEFASEGVYRSSRLTTNLTLRTSRLTVYGYYTLRFDKSDAESSSFPSNQYNLGVDYGRSLGDVRHTLTAGEHWTLPFGMETSGYVQAMSGAPFNIVTGQDGNGDTQFNDRPAFATDRTRTSVVTTRWGVFDASPIAGQTIIPRNYVQGPGMFVVNLALGKSWGLGREVKSAGGARGGAQPSRYTMELWAESQNLLNHANLTPPVGTLSSPLFGQSIGVTGGSSLSADRVVDLQLSLRF